MESEMQKEIREIEEKKMIIEREKREKEMQIREKEIQLQKEIKEREFEARIFIEKKKTIILTLLNTCVLFLLSMKMKLTSIFFFSKKWQKILTGL